MRRKHLKNANLIADPPRSGSINKTEENIISKDKSNTHFHKINNHKEDYLQKKRKKGKEKNETLEETKSSTVKTFGLLNNYSTLNFHFYEDFNKLITDDIVIPRDPIKLKRLKIEVIIIL